MPAQLKRRLFIFLLLVLLIAGGFFAHWFFKGRFYESTDNAYVQGEITRISSQLGARIDDVRVLDALRNAGAKTGGQEFIHLINFRCLGSAQNLVNVPGGRVTVGQ